jgi:2'-5' RNA ligase
MGSTDTKQLSAHQFKDMYAELGYSLDKLGCIMLDLEPLKFDLREADAYYAKDKKRFWIAGNVAGKTPHVTLLYGLIRSGEELKKHVDTVLDGTIPKTVTVDHVSYFDTPPNVDEDYYCIVAHLKITSELQEAHERLQFLPHIDTFTGYKAHFTLCYIKKDKTKRDFIIDKLNKKYAGKEIKAGKLNYGGEHE